MSKPIGTSITQREILRFWAPLAASWLLMSAEGPVLQAAIARLADMQTQLAAFGIVMGLEITIESPVIMLLATSTALGAGAGNYRTLRTFMICINLAVTVVAVLVAFTPLYGAIVQVWMGVPPQIAEAARPGMKIMTLWSAAIGFRRHLQGILIRHGETRWVGYGTAARLAASGGGGILLAWATPLPGVWIASIALMAGVVLEAAFVWHAGRPTVRRILAEADPAGSDALTLRDVTRYHAPLAATSLLTLLAQPIIGAGLARMQRPEENLAAWPVIWGIAFVMRSSAFALPEAVIALLADQRYRDEVRRFCARVGCASSGLLAVFAFTPLIDLYLHYVAGLPAPLAAIVVSGVALSLPLPVINAVHSWYRGLLMSSRRTGTIYRGMALNLAATTLLIVAGVAFGSPGAATGIVSVTAAHVVEVWYLRERTLRPPA